MYMFTGQDINIYQIRRQKSKKSKNKTSKAKEPNTFSQSRRSRSIMQKHLKHAGQKTGWKKPNNMEMLLCHGTKFLGQGVPSVAMETADKNINIDESS